MVLPSPGIPDKTEDLFWDITASQWVETALSMEVFDRDLRDAYCLPNPLICLGLQLNGKSILALVFNMLPHSREAGSPAKAYSHPVVTMPGEKLVC